MNSDHVRKRTLPIITRKDVLLKAMRTEMLCNSVDECEWWLADSGRDVDWALGRRVVREGLVNLVAFGDGCMYDLPSVADKDQVAK